MMAGADIGGSIGEVAGAGHDARSGGVAEVSNLNVCRPVSMAGAGKCDRPGEGVSCWWCWQARRGNRSW